MSYSKQQIESFIAIQKPKEPLFLFGCNRVSFFDNDVQEVLEPLHPDNAKYPDESWNAFPVNIYSAADTFVISGSRESWNRLYDLQTFADVSKIVALLIVALRISYESRGEQTTINQLQSWRNNYALAEMNRFTVSHEDQTKFKTLFKRLREKDPKGNVPLVPTEKVPPPRRWFEGIKKPANSGGATRAAVARENARREKIMRHWAECWLAHLGVIPAAVTKTAPKK